MAVTNTGIVLRTITGVNESDLFLDSESTSVATNTGIVERSIVGVHDANFVHPLGDELISNGDFSNGSTGWAFAAGWSVVNNQATTLGVSLTPIRQTVLVNGTNRLTFDVVEGGAIVYTNYPIFSIKATFSTVGTHTIDLLSDGVGDNRFLYFYNNGAGNSATIDNVSVKEMLVNRESTTTNTGIVERPITGVNDGGDLFLDESTSVVNNTGIVERPITGVNTSDALFPDNTESTVVNISDTIIPLLTALEARATTFENREGTQNILINLEKC